MPLHWRKGEFPVRVLGPGDMRPAEHLVTGQAYGPLLLHRSPDVKADGTGSNLWCVSHRASGLLVFSSTQEDLCRRVLLTCAHRWPKEFSKTDPEKVSKSLRGLGVAAWLLAARREDKWLEPPEVIPF